MSVRMRKTKTYNIQSTIRIRETSSAGNPTTFNTMTIVTSPACGIPAAPMLAAVDVMLHISKKRCEELKIESFIIESIKSILMNVFLHHVLRFTAKNLGTKTSHIRVLLYSCTYGSQFWVPIFLNTITKLLLYYYLEIL